MFAPRRMSPRLAIAIAFVLRGFVQGSWYPRIPGVVAQAEVDSAHLGVIFFLLALGNIIAFSLAARFISRIGTARTHLIFAVPLPLAIMALGVVPSTAWLAAGMLIFGLLVGAYDISTSVQSAVVERRTFTPLISAMYGLYSVGALLGAFSSGFVAQWGVPIPVHFGVIGLVTVPLTIVATFSMLPDDISPIPGARRRRLPTFPPRALVPLGLVIVCIAIGEETINNWVALYLREDLGAKPALAGFAYTAFSIATAIGRLLGDRVIAVVGVDRTLMAGSLLAALGMGGGMIINQPVSIIIGYTLVGLGLSVVVPVTYRRANQIPGISPANAVATVASIGFIGFLVGPLIIGAVANALSLRVAIGIVAGIVLGIFVITSLNPSPQPAAPGHAGPQGGHE